jgi:ABC-2 type transport system permease protein
MSKMTRVVDPVPRVGRTTQARAPSQWAAFVAMTRASFVAQTRSLANLFFGFLFPLVFIAVFGLLGNGGTNIKLGVSDGSDQQSPIYLALTHISAVQLSHGSASSLEADLRSGKLDGVLSITAVPIPAGQGPGQTVPSQGSPTVAPGAGSQPAAGGQPGTGGFPGAAGTGYAVTLTTTSASPQNAAAAQAFVQGVVDQVNVRAAGITTPAVTLATKDIAGRKYTYIDFVLPGQLGFSLLSIAIFGTAFGFVVLKRTLVFKRIFATPTRPTTIVLAQGASRLIIAFAQVIVLLVAGVYFFNFYLAHGAETFAEMLLVSLFGLVAFLGFGLIVAGNFRDENAMGPVVNLITLPQFLLGGSFFPTDSFPKWLQPVANNLPLSYLNDALRKIASDGASLYDVRWQLLGILAWGVVTYLVAIRTFKWE